jgi:hypothetical protein
VFPGPQLPAPDGKAWADSLRRAAMRRTGLAKRIVAFYAIKGFLEPIAFNLL